MNDGVRIGELMLVRLADEKKAALGDFPHAPRYVEDIRCDLHPRRRPDGLAVTFDSVHEGTRQVYMADVADIIAA